MPARIKNRLWVCLCATMLLVGIDIGFFGFSYAMPFVDAIDFVRLALLALCVAWFCAPVLTLATLGFEAITTFGPLKRATRYVPVVFSITLALFLVAVVNQSAGKVFAFAPWWQSVAALIVAALYFGLFRIVEKKWPAASVVIACFSALAVALFLVTYLPLYLQGGFGFTGHSQTVMRTAMTAAIVIAGLGLPIVYAVWDRLWSRLPAIALTIAALLTLLVAHVVNITLYVDNYPEIHNFIALFSIGLCVDLFLRRLGDAPKRTFIAVAVLFHVGLFGIVTSRGTNPGYVGAVHTGWIRYGLHLFHHEIGNAPRNARNFVVKNRYRIEKRLGKKRAVQTTGELPKTFAPVEPTGEYNVVWILLDMKRPQEFTDAATPHTMTCFENGAEFDFAYTNAPKTNIAYPALYTSTYPATRHENQNTVTHDPYWFAYNDNFNAGSIFSSAGFVTNVVTNSWYNTQFFSKKSESEYFGGFERVVVESEKGTTHTERLQAAFDQNRDVIPETGKFFTVFHVFEHWPEQLGEVDRFIGSVCDEIKSKNRWSDTVVMLAADHGVQRREHGRTHYGMTLFEEEVRVPLKVRVPSAEPKRYAHNVTLIDLLPTSIALAGVETPAKFEGRSLFDPTPRDHFLETRLLSFPSSAIVSERWKLIRWRTTGHEALFDLDADPGELKNVIEEQPEIANKLRTRLDAFLSARDETEWP